MPRKGVSSMKGPATSNLCSECNFRMFALSCGALEGALRAQKSILRRAPQTGQ
jgi:hypothetical protein